jgi:hypothetical protein
MTQTWPLFEQMYVEILRLAQGGQPQKRVFRPTDFDFPGNSRVVRNVQRVGPINCLYKVFFGPSLLATALYAPGVASGAPGGAVKGFYRKITVAMRAVTHLLYTAKKQMYSEKIESTGGKMRLGGPK